MMGAIQPSFQVSERTVNLKGMRVGGMKPMFVAFQRGFGIPPPTIGVNLAAGGHTLLQKVANRDGIGSLGQRQAKASGLFHFLSMLVGVGDDFDGPEN
jgi:hypothetical protein